MKMKIGERVDWKITANGEHLWLGPRFFDWLKMAGEQKIDFYRRKAEEFPGLRFSPSTWIEDPGKDVLEWATILGNLNKP